MLTSGHQPGNQVSDRKGRCWLWQSALVFKLPCLATHVYQQMAGGSIGLELTGAVSRTFMLRWDQLYKAFVKKSGVDLLMYETYVDDSNQVAIVPPPGSRYDADSKKVVTDETLIDINEHDDARTAKILAEIANGILPGITMEYDVPS